jgi:hypothetical protein
VMKIRQKKWRDKNLVIKNGKLNTTGG